MPDDDDFNPDSMLPELTKPTPDLDDSLCFDEGEETQLPAFDELDIGVPSVSELHEDNSTTRTEPDKGSGEDLNDSLCGDNADEETQYHMDTANDIQPAAQSTPTPNLNDSMEMVGEDDTLQATTHSPEASKLPPSQTKVLSGNKGAGDDDPNLDELFPETICDPQDCSQEGEETENGVQKGKMNKRMLKSFGSKIFLTSLILSVIALSGASGMSWQEEGKERIKEEKEGKKEGKRGKREIQVRTCMTSNRL